MSKRLGELWATVPTNEKYVSKKLILILVLFYCPDIRAVKI